MADDMSHVDKVTVNAVARPDDMPRWSPFIGSTERRDGQSDQQENE
jgi:hypothetical protein